MLDKLEAIKERFDEVSQLTDPEVIPDMKQYIQPKKNTKICSLLWRRTRHKKSLSNIETRELLKDEEMKEMAKMELDELQPQQQVMEEEIKVLLIPKDPADSKNAVVEIVRDGGDEASILQEIYTECIKLRGSKG